MTKKFKYQNNLGEEAEFEAVDLTNEIYEQLLDLDRQFLSGVVAKQEPFFEEQEFIDAAATMLKSHGLGKETKPVQKLDDSEILLVINRKVIKPVESKKKKTETPKQMLREKLASSKIRLFKKEKMQFQL
jgi:hypothetical protein